MNDAEKRALADAVRDACVHVLLQAYEDAKISGLCHEGAWEVAVQALRAQDADALLRDGASGN